MKKQNSKKTRRVSQKKQYESIKTGLLLFQKSVDDEFCDDNVFTFVKKHCNEIQNITVAKKLLEELVNDFLEFNDSLVRRYDEDEDKFYFLTLDSLFTGALFCIKPTAEERRENILFPGHRFMPFCSSFIDYKKLTLLTESGEPVARKTVSRHLSQLMIYHSLFGLEQFLNLAIDECEENEDKIIDLEPDPELQMSAFDLTDVYKQYDFKEGDCLVCKVEDYDEGVCRLSYLPVEELRKSVGTISRWNQYFADGLKNYIENVDAPVDIEEQLAYAFYSNREFLLTNPVVHIGGFLDQSEEFRIGEYQEGTFIVNDEFESEGEGLPFMDLDHAGDTPFDEFYDDFPFEIPEDMGEFDQLMNFMGFSITEQEVEAYMRDELFRNPNSGSSQHVIERCFDERLSWPEFSDYKADFFAMLNDLWGRVKATYNRFADDQAGELRSAFLKLNDMQIEWLRKADEKNLDPEDVPRKDMVAFSEVNRNICDVIVALNDPGDISDRELQGIKKMIPSLEHIVKQTMKVLDAKT